MGKISSVYNIGKNYIRRFFGKTVKTSEEPVSIMEKAVSEPQKVTSKEIEAYYRRYNKHLTPPKPKEPAEVQISESEPYPLFEEISEYEFKTANEVSKTVLESLSHNFEQKKQTILDILEKNSDIIPPNVLITAKNINTPETLAHFIRNYVNNSSKYLKARQIQGCLKAICEKKISLSLQKELYEKGRKMAGSYLEMIKAVTVPSTDSRVIKIENYLKSMYGMDYVHLENFEEAKKILQTINIIKKTDIPLADTIIITPFTPRNTKGVNLLLSKSKNAVIIRSEAEETQIMQEAYNLLSEEAKKVIDEEFPNLCTDCMSTNHPLHYYVHEFAHSRQCLNSFLLYVLKIVPREVKAKVPNLGEYALTTNQVEFENELVTKDILQGLNKTERAILDSYI